MADLQKLTGLLNFTCTHYSHKCVLLIAAVDTYHKGGGKVSQQFMSQYIKQITRNHANYNSCVHSAGTYTWVTTLINMLQYLEPTIDDMLTLITGFQDNRRGYGTITT